MTTDGRERGAKLRDDIYAAYERAQETRRPRSLRPSAIGRECERSLWMSFRWAEELKMFSGNMLRLFETGHSQEDRLVGDLKRLGVEVAVRDQDDPKKQIGFELFDGHMNGFIDLAAVDVPHSTQEWVIGECKSHNAKSFAKLEKEGVAVSKPEHYAQSQMYLHAFDVQEALYLAASKDTDRLYFEFLPRDQRYIDRIIDKGNRIIFGYGAPPKINKSGDFFVCKMCDARAVCQEGKLPDRSCRTCMAGRPIPSHQVPIPEDWPHDPISGLPVDWVPPKGAWWCDIHETTLSLDAQKAGCEAHRYHTGMVDGDNTEAEADPDGISENYVYRMKDGSTWVDRGPAHDGQRESPPPVKEPEPTA